MNAPEPRDENAQAVERLTALWGLTEAGLGGVVHALKIPFTGIVVGSTAIILITLIAWYGRRQASVILRATMIVLIIKAGVSPHTPVPAYVAVLFQGALAALLFSVVPNLRIAAMILGVLALLEGVCHKFVVLTLVYGRSVWDAMNLVGDKLAAQWGLAEGTIQASYWVVGVYAVYYGIGGLVVGWLAGIIPSRIERMLASDEMDALREDVARSDNDLPVGRKRHWALRRLLPAVVVLVLIAAVFLMDREDAAGSRRVVYVVMRALVVMGVWFYVLGPLVRAGIHRFLGREKNAYRHELERAMDLMPHLRVMAGRAWARTAKERRLVRWYHFVTLMVVYSLVCDDGMKGQNPNRGKET
jgi:hypothetical protein